MKNLVIATFFDGSDKKYADDNLSKEEIVDLFNEKAIDDLVEIFVISNDDEERSPVVKHHWTAEGGDFDDIDDEIPF